MRQLRAVGISADGRYLQLASSARGEPTHKLALDETLRAAVRGDWTGADGPVESALTPREIQARLRAGETPEKLARAAGVPITRITRYSGPVESERNRVIEQARAARMSKARVGSSAVPLGAAVDAALAAMPGVDPELAAWTARRRPDGSWVVTLRWDGRGGARRAEWLLDPAARAVTGLDAAARRLGFVAGPPPKRGTRKAAAPAARPTKAAPKKAAPKNAAPKKAAPKKAASKKAAPKKAARARG